MVANQQRRNRPSPHRGVTAVTTLRKPDAYLEVADRYLNLVDQIATHVADMGELADVPPLLTMLTRVAAVHIEMAKVSTFAGPYLFELGAKDEAPAGKEKGE
jgi:hypothetical protein